MHQQPTSNLGNLDWFRQIDAPVRPTVLPLTDADLDALQSRVVPHAGNLLGVVL